MLDQIISTPTKETPVETKTINQQPAQTPPPAPKKPVKKPMSP